MIGIFAVVKAASAAQQMNPPGLMPTAIARPLFEQDPGVAAARAGLDVALQEASILDQSPYEWTARVDGQQRRVENGARYNEWFVGAEKTIRLPGKATADRSIGKATVDESRARYGEALLTSARELMELWVDWLAAERARELGGSSLQSMQASLAAVEKRARTGDASKLDLGITRAELAEQRRMDNYAKTQAAAAWLRLSTRFPGVERQLLALPEPLVLGSEAPSWQERILTETFSINPLRYSLSEIFLDRKRDRPNFERPRPSSIKLRSRDLDGRSRIDLPFNVTDPPFAFSDPAIHFNISDLPDPEPPTIPKTSPSSTSNEASRRTHVLPVRLESLST